MESIPEEIRMVIMKYLPNADLVNCSLVNKRLNYEARSVMRNRGSLFAYLDIDEPCQDTMIAFISMVEQMTVIPFSGIHFWIHADHFEQCQPWSAEMTDRIYKEILCLPWKQLSLGIDVAWQDDSIHCPAFLLSKRILKDLSGVLENLSLSLETPSQQEELVQQVVRQQCYFPRLKILNLEETWYGTSQDSYLSYIKAFVSRAPNLQQVHIHGKINLRDNVLEGSSAVLVPKAGRLEVSEYISESLASAIRTENLSINIVGRHPDTERYNRVIPMLLQASSKTLRCMKINLELLLPLMYYGVCLENVRQLELSSINYHYSDLPHVLRVVKGFDFTRIFPNLSEVFITNNPLVLRPNAVNAFVEQGIAILKEPLPDRAVNIKKLDLDFQVQDIALYGEMFPQAEILSVVAFARPPSFFGDSIIYIWQNWTRLKELKIKFICPIEYNLDSAFCGIFPEEVAELREKDEEYLKSVNIVPVMPSITCLKDLRRLELSGRCKVFVPRHEVPTLIFSKVSVLIAFGRCPFAAVTLRSDDPDVHQALRHMEPYASVGINVDSRIEDQSK